MKSSVDQIIEHACNDHSVSLNLSHLGIIDETVQGNGPRPLTDEQQPTDNAA